MLRWSHNFFVHSGNVHTKMIRMYDEWLNFKNYYSKRHITINHPSKHSSLLWIYLSHCFHHLWISPGSPVLWLCLWGLIKQTVSSIVLHRPLQKQACETLCCLLLCLLTPPGTTWFLLLRQGKNDHERISFSNQFCSLKKPNCVTKDIHDRGFPELL